MEKESSVFEDQFANKQEVKKPNKPEHVTYINNPFLMFVPAIQKLFEFNTNSALWVIALGLVPSFFNLFTTPLMPKSESSASVSGVVVVVGLIVFLAIIVFAFMVQAMAQFIGYKSVQNETVTIQETFDVVRKKFWTIVGIQLLIGLKILGGLLLFIIPGVRASIRYNLSLFAMFSENLGVSASLKRSKQLTNKRLTEGFAVGLLGSIIPFIGPPLQAAMLSTEFMQLRAYKDGGKELPPTHKASYFILLGLCALIALVFLLFAGLLIFLASGSDTLNY